MATSGQEQQYKIASAIISADRFAGQTADVANMIVELDLFEDLEKPYLTGSLVLIDDAGLFDAFSFRGSERITLTVLSIDKVEEPFINERTFVMSKVERTKRANDRTEVHLISLVEEHLYLSSLQKISRTYTSNIEDMITNILLLDLNKESDLSYLSSSAQGVRKINIPYLSPLSACDFLRDRATTQSGAPFFLFSSLYNNSIRLGSLDTMLQALPFNSRQPYVFSSSVSSEANSLKPDEASFIVNAARFEGMSDNLKMIQQGAVSSVYNVIDVNSGLVTYNKHKASNLVSKLEQENTILEKKQTMFDPLHYISDQILDEYDSKVYHQLASKNTYGSFLGYHDVVKNEDHLLKLYSVALRNFLYNNMININVPGVPFAYSKVSVGDTIQCEFLNPRGAENTTHTEDLIDKNKSGKYLIYATRHIFKETSHNISVNLTKIDNNGATNA